MAVLRIVRLAQGSITAASTGTGGANLSTPDPKEVWVAGTTANQQIVIDLGSSRLIDCVYLGATNFPIGMMVSVRTYNLSNGSDVIDAALGVPVAVSMFDTGRSCVVATFTPRFARYAVVDTLNTSPSVTLRAGIAVAGMSISPSYGHEWGSGRGVIDTGNRERLIGGGFGLSAGARKSTWRWTLGDLTDVEVQILAGIALATGETVPILVIEDPDLGEVSALNSYNTTVAGRTVTKVAVSAAWDALATTGVSMVSSSVSFRPSQTDKALMVGFHGAAIEPNPSALDYAIYPYFDSNLYVIESGNIKFTVGSYNATDLLAITDDGQTISYFKNGSVVYQSAKVLNKPLYCNMSFYNPGGAVRDVIIAPGGLSERIHYGLFDRFDPYERREVGMTKWGFSLEEWV